MRLTQHDLRGATVQDGKDMWRMVWKWIDLEAEVIPVPGRGFRYVRHTQ